MLTYPHDSAFSHPFPSPVLAAKAEHPTSYYVWRTEHDGKVRPEHAANDGKIFAWDDPPPTGHPGEAYGCRCRSEAYYGSIERWLNNGEPKRINAVIDKLRDVIARATVWDNLHFSLYFYLGGGKPVTLDAIGHFETIKRYYGDHHIKRLYEALRAEAKNAPDGPLPYQFDTSYNFLAVLYTYDSAAIKGDFNGMVTTFPRQRIISGICNILFYDDFKDPLELIEIPLIILNLLPFVDIKEADLSATIRHFGDLGGTAFRILGGWESVIYLDAAIEK